MSSIKQTENQTDQSSVREDEKITPVDEKNVGADNGMTPSPETDQALTVGEPSMESNEIVEMDEPTDDMLNTTTLLEETQVKHYRARYQELEELLEFAAESGKLDPPNLAIEVKKLKKVLFYSPPNMLTQEALCDTEARLEELYAILAELVSPVTVLTLRTTSEEYAVQRSWWGNVFFGSSSVGRNFFRQLFWIAMLLVGLISLRKLIGGPEDPLAFVDPFLYGALGALIYLYKGLTKLYINRTLHPKKLSTNWLRLFMGALTGALIVNLFGQFFDSASAEMGVSKVAIGFLAGYSVEFFYRSLDRIIEIITPKAKTQTDSTVPMTPKQAQIETLTKSLKEMTNEADKATIRLLLEKL